MATKNSPQNGHNKLEDALATLVQNQASFVQTEEAFVRRLAENDRLRLEYEHRHLEFERRHFEFERETKDRFARIESQMAEIIRVLTDHSRQLERLPEAVRDKIGFKV